MAGIRIGFEHLVVTLDTRSRHRMCIWRRPAEKHRGAVDREHAPAAPLAGDEENHAFPPRAAAAGAHAQRPCHANNNDRRLRHRHSEEHDGDAQNPFFPEHVRHQGGRDGGRRQAVGRKTTTKTILDDCSGYALESSITAILGFSGAGKSTLLDIIAGRTSRTSASSSSTMRSSGTIAFNGEVAGAALRRRVTAFVVQDDGAHLGALTVRETIRFAAWLRLPLSMRAADKSAVVTRTLHILELNKCADRPVGNALRRGISGGEKRRVTIAEQLVTSPRVLVLDEPTSGLDSTTTMSVMLMLHRLARSERITMVASLHSPSSKVFRLVDTVILMVRGHVAYCGPVARVATYFEALGHSCPSMRSIPEFCLDMLYCAPSSASDARRLHALVQGWKRHGLNMHEAAAQVSGDYVSRQQQHMPLITPQPDFGAAAAAAAGNDDEKAGANGLDHLFGEEHGERSARNGSASCHFLAELRILAYRNWLNYSRDPACTVIRLGECVFLSLFVGLLYFQAERNQKGIIARIGFLFFMLSIQAFLSAIHAVLTFAEERPLFLKERSSKLYHVSAYFLAKTLVELPFLIVLPFVFGALGYWMVGLKSDRDAFLRFSLAMILLSNATHSVGLVLGACVKEPMVALLLSPLTMVPFMLVTGFFIHLDTIPVYLSWLQYIAPQKYVFEAIMGIEFEGLHFVCDDDESYIIPTPTGLGSFCPFTRGDQILDKFGLRSGESRFLYDVVCVFALFCGYRVLAFAALRKFTNVDVVGL